MALTSDHHHISTSVKRHATNSQLTEKRHNAEANQAYHQVLRFIGSSRSEWGRGIHTSDSIRAWAAARWRQVAASHLHLHLHLSSLHSRLRPWRWSGDLSGLRYIYTRPPPDSPPRRPRASRQKLCRDGDVARRSSIVTA